MKDVLDKYLQQIYDKELLYKEGVVENNGMIEIRDVERIFKQFTKEIEEQLRKKD